MLSRISTVSLINGCSQQPCVAFAEVWARDPCRAGTNVVLLGAHVHPIGLVWGPSKLAAGLTWLSSTGRVTSGYKGKGGFLVSSNHCLAEF